MRANRTVVAAAIICLGAAAGCSSSEPAATPAATTTTVALPEYKVSDDGKHTVTIATAATDPVQWRAMFDRARASHTTGDGWLVYVECPTAAPGGRPKTVANGAFANTQKGLAVTGLASVDAVELKATGLTCT